MLDWRGQLELVRAMLSSETVCKELAPVLQAHHFENPAMGLLVHAVGRCSSKFGTVPTPGVLHTEISASGLSQRVQDAAMDILGEVLGIPAPPVQWALEHGRKQAAEATLLTLAANAKGFVNTGNYDGFLAEARKASHLVRIGGNLTYGAHDLLERYGRDLPLGIRLGIAELDKRFDGGHGPRRGRLVLYLGMENAGKSHCLVSVACNALLQGLNVLYIPLEMDEYETRCRIDRSLSGYTEDELPHVLQDIHGDLKTLQRRLVISEATDYPLSVQGVESILDRLPEEAKPDIVLIDYAQLMFAGSVGTGDIGVAQRLGIDAIHQQLRILAQQREFLVVTAYQGNRGGFKTQDSRTQNDEPLVLRARDMADSLGPARHADVIITINQTPAEYESSRGRLFIDKNRCGKKMVLVECVFDWARSRVYGFHEAAPGKIVPPVSKV